MKLEYPHSFSQEEAIARIRALTDYWKKYDVRSEWQADSARINGKVKGVSFEGTFRLLPGMLSAEVKVGFLAEKLGGRAYVERKLTEYLDPGRTLAELQSRT
jgi:hypothetical protein